MLYLHPILSILTIALSIYVGFSGWNYYQKIPELRLNHVKKGKLFLVMLGIVWLMGLVGVAIAQGENKPASSGHFFIGTAILGGLK